MVYRIYVEKKEGLAHEAASLYSDLKNLLQIEGLKAIRILNRYDAENLDEALFNYAKTTVFSEPQLDIVTDDFAVELNGESLKPSGAAIRQIILSSVAHENHYGRAVYSVVGKCD